MNRFTEVFRAGSLVVSCQAYPPNPLSGSATMALMAQAAELGGAEGIRANGLADVSAIAATVAIPVIGIDKIGSDGVFITPDAETAMALFRAGATVVAMDGTQRERRNGRSFAEEIARIRDAGGGAVMADVDDLRAGVAAAEAGADAVATTLSGYTSGGTHPVEPDLDLIAALVAEVDCPIVAEGRIRTAADLIAARQAGAWTVVMGTAVTNPLEHVAYLQSALEAVRM
ncbi:putative N-acetylmannosamine-6-phosphate 2-epimerase [Microbacterium lushaniae]|nr:putative N-acetylmannosamine-6-phosphate 2-epimerase [Microbacterium lushaniae]KAA9157415.1 putative N-acetylmannosamine-6-phosphate 2-epimerase [Microbacterium lushaniae]